MISSPKSIYKKVAEKNSLPLEMIDSIGTTVFQTLRSILNDPKELAYELPELGTFNVRFKAYDSYYKYVLQQIAEGNENFITRFVDDPEKLAKLENICSKMEEYRNDKKETRQKRNEYDNTIESSQDNIA